MTLISQALHLAVARMATHPKTLEELHRRHNMHTLSGNWRGRYECHVANAGGLAGDLVIERFGRVLRAYWQPRRIIPVNRR